MTSITIPDELDKKISQASSMLAIGNRTAFIKFACNKLADEVLGDKHGE